MANKHPIHNEVFLVPGGVYSIVSKYLPAIILTVCLLFPSFVSHAAGFDTVS